MSWHASFTLVGIVPTLGTSVGAIVVGVKMRGHVGDRDSRILIHLREHGVELIHADERLGGLGGAARAVHVVAEVGIGVFNAHEVSIGSGR